MRSTGETVAVGGRVRGRGQATEGTKKAAQQRHSLHVDSGREYEPVLKQNGMRQFFGASRAVENGSRRQTANSQ